MITFAVCDQGSDEVVSGGVLVVKGSIAKPVGQRVDTEGRMVNEEESASAGVEETAAPVSPTKTCNCHGHDETHDENERNVVLVLPSHYGALVEIADVRITDLASGFPEHPANVGPPEALVSVVGVEVGVRVAVMRSMAARPPSNGTLNRSSAS